MSEEVVRQTRSQKRALERDGPSGQQDGKKARLERGTEAGGEVKATIKVEVQAKDQPVDMSTTKSDVKQERNSPSPDVIVLSDNEPSSPRVNGVNHVGGGMDTELLMRSTPKEREQIIKQLKEELRLEEARLVLLKKLRQSQIQKESSAPKTTGPSVATPPPLVRGSMATTKGSLQLVPGRTSGAVIPPPLVRGGQQVSSKLGLSGTQIVMPPLVRGAQVHGQRQQQQHAASGPPPLLLAPRAAVPSVQIQGQRIIQQGLIRVASVPSASVLVNIPQASPTTLKGSALTSQVGLGAAAGVGGSADSPASRQAAAKLALRKQLEKALLEIPPPKPPTPDLNFLPSAANNEFIYLVGLEEVVQNLLDTLGKGKSPATPASAVTKEPYTCAQCKTDFTCRWRQEKSGSILCEQCMASNQKRALKAEHTSRLKAAFVKALQQEQEMEQRILQQQAASPTSHPTSTSSSSTPSSSSSSAMKVDPQALVAQQMKQARNSSLHSRGTPIERQHSNIKQSTGQLSRVVHPATARGVAHTFPSSSQLQSAVAAAALVGTPGKHAARAGTKAAGSRGSPSVGTWRKQKALSTGVTMAYVNPSLTMHKASSAVERQREYLLDMIPSRSISQTANTWK